jgi:hypothetical protein
LGRLSWLQTAGIAFALFVANATGEKNFRTGKFFTACNSAGRRPLLRVGNAYFKSVGRGSPDNMSATCNGGVGEINMNHHNKRIEARTVEIRQAY